MRARDSFEFVICLFSFWGDFDWKVKAQIAILTWYLAPRFLKYVLEYHPGFLGKMQTCLSLGICLIVKRNKGRTEHIHRAVSGHRASPFRQGRGQESGSRGSPRSRCVPGALRGGPCWPLTGGSALLFW